ncbi:MAG: response regulator transcription factor [Campylobacterota bacterium]|nr:response regulator transcription factor [Campylobacterota bacterium]
MTKLLLLEDDPLFAETLIDLLEEASYGVIHFTNGQAALDGTFESKYDAYLLDVNVPLIDGVSLLSELRSADDKTPAIFLTSHKDKETLKKSFLSGADDFLTKPFDLDELLWRLAAVIKRTKKEQPSQVGLLSHDTLHKSIFYDGTELELSQKEYALLVLLMTHLNASVTKELIYDELWSRGEGGSDGAIRVYINRLKQLLPDMTIENIRGVGYRLVQ